MQKTPWHLDYVQASRGFLGGLDQSFWVGRYTRPGIFFGLFICQRQPGLVSRPG